MNKNVTRNEAHNFLFDLLNWEKKLHTTDDDMVWDKIIKEIMEYDKLNSYYMGEPELPCPIQQTERPDIMFECADFVMGIECFRFDASKKTRKGSTQKQQEILVNRKHTKEYENMKVKPRKLIVFEDIVRAKFSVENYKAALLSSFCEHAKKIPEYRQTIKEKCLKKKGFLSFYIEDATAIGNWINTKNGIEPMNPLCIREFIDELSKTVNLDYVIIKHQVIPYVSGMHIQKICPEFIDSLYAESYDFSKDKYVPYSYSIESRIHHEI